MDVIVPLQGYPQQVCISGQCFYSQDLFSGIKRLGVFLLISEWDASPSASSLGENQFVDSYLHSWVGERILRGNCPALEHITIKGKNVIKKSKLWYDTQSTGCYLMIMMKELISFASEGGTPWITKSSKGGDGHFLTTIKCLRLIGIWKPLLIREPWLPTASFNSCCYIPRLSLNKMNTGIGWLLVTCPWSNSNVSRPGYNCAVHGCPHVEFCYMII